MIIKTITRPKTAECEARVGSEETSTENCIHALFQNLIAIISCRSVSQMLAHFSAVRF